MKMMKKFMDADPAVRIQYASKYASISNYWKYFIGQQEQLKRNKVYDKKVALEQMLASMFTSLRETILKNFSRLLIVL